MTGPARPTLHEALTGAGWAYTAEQVIAASPPHAPTRTADCDVYDSGVGPVVRVRSEGHGRIVCGGIWRFPPWLPDEVVVAAAEAARVWAEGQGD